MNQYLGIDIGGTSIKIGLFSFNGTLEKKWEIDTLAYLPSKEIIKNIIIFLKSKINLNVINGIGLGVPGIIENGIVKEAVNLNWYNLDLKKLFKEELNMSSIEIALENDARLAALGEYKQLQFKSNLKSIFMFTIGTGVGGGYISNYQIMDDIKIFGTEIGHLKVDNDINYQCSCGEYGCLETVSSASGIVRLSKDYLTMKKIAHQDLKAKDIIDLAKSGNSLYEQIIEESIKPLSKAIEEVFAKINPDKIVIGGGVSKAGDYYLNKIYDYAKTQGFNWENKVILAELDNDAGIYGGYYFVNMNENKKPYFMCY